MKLSYSSMTKLLQCPRKYYYYYVKRYRDKYYRSAFLIGSTFDEAVEIMMLRKKKELTDEEKEKVAKCPYDFAYEYMKNITHNYREIYAPTSTLIKYTKKDFQVELLQDSDYETLRNFISEVLGKDVVPMVLRDELLERRECGEMLDFDEWKYLALCNWLSCWRKVEIMLHHVEDEILPQITEVYSTQRKVEFGSIKSGLIEGYIDIECKFADEDFIRTTDLKSCTGFGQYGSKSATESIQLNLYDSNTENKKLAYIAVDKVIRMDKVRTCSICGKSTNRRVKTCPEPGETKKRCGGEFSEDIQIIPYVKSKIVKGEANDEIKREIFDKFNICFDILEESWDNYIYDKYGDDEHDEEFDLGKLRMEDFPQDREKCGVNANYGYPCENCGLCEGRDDAMKYLEDLGERC